MPCHVVPNFVNPIQESIRTNCKLKELKNYKNETIHMGCLKGYVKAEVFPMIQ